MVNKDLVLVSVEMDPVLTLTEICQICQISPEFMVEIVNFGIIEPCGRTEKDWRFESKHIRKIRTVIHLQEDLEVNLAGAAVATQLMEKIESLEGELDKLRKYFRNSSWPS